MTMSLRTTRILTISLVAVATIASGTITYVVGDHYDDRRRADQIRSLGLGVRPTPLWTLDTTRLTDEPGAVLLSVSSPGSGTNGYGLVVDSSENLIASVGRPRAFDVVAGVTLVGVDRLDGAPRWRRAVGPVSNCTAGPVRESIACWSPTRVIIVDTATGRVRGEAEPDFTVTAVDVDGDATYVSGTRGVGASAAVVLARGTVDAPLSSTTTTIPSAGLGASITEVSPDRDVFIVRSNADQDIMFRSVAYALDTGARRFAFDGIVTTIGDDLFRSETYPQGIERLLTDTGTTVATQELSLPGGSFAPQVLATPFAPVVMGDGVFDPGTGALLWRNPVLDWGRAVGGNTIAVIGGVLVVASLDGRLIGLDARTGRQLWTTPFAGAYFVRSGITDGRHLVIGDQNGMHSIDAVTGRIVWTVPQSPAGAQLITTVSGSDGDIVRGVNSSVSVWRARKGGDG